MEEELTELERWSKASVSMQAAVDKFAPIVLSNHKNGILGTTVNEVLKSLLIDAEMYQFDWLYDKYRSAFEVPTSWGYKLLSSEDVYMTRLIERLEEENVRDVFDSYMEEYKKWIELPTPQSQEA